MQADERVNSVEFRTTSKGEWSFTVKCYAKEPLDAYDEAKRYAEAITMAYHPRATRDSWQQASEQFPVLLLTGPRQVGKTTFLQRICGKNRRYVTLDDPTLRTLAIEDPALLLQRFEPPVFVKLYFNPVSDRAATGVASQLYQLARCKGRINIQQDMRRLRSWWRLLQ